MSDMAVIEISEPGGPEVMRLARRPVPQPGPGQVLVKVTAAGVNGPDLKQRKGAYPPPPGASDLMGLEVSGEVVELGEGAWRWQVGDRVCALTNGGGYAEYVTIDARHCLALPEGVDEVDAAGLCETYFTVWSNIFHGHAIPDGALFLVHGGSGGIGSTAVQLGAARGLRVFSTAGTDKGLDFIRSLGAERAINYRSEDFVEIVKEAGGARVILDFMGGDYVARNFSAAGMDCRIVQLAFDRGAKVELNLGPIMMKRLILTGSTLRPRPPEFKAAVARGLEAEAWPLFATGRLRTVTHAVLPMKDVAEAHRILEAGGHQGKVILKM
ncbi:NAD(P)H-quinone oxidoreductase [Limibaculum sp. FT325]|uniref:NAD(P)H-quinone oxidoreductase n=1 Tax=Thermohalobaculum sediminis TaxID=2939436 RepID=UPI0020BE9AB9|nr:NAD(P)H-quinone oxidoreductase [Limibaculum sediminis]MCL5776730.1 NAD(P)H-quinone oxidoreductase [Limibaculum sediminis]